MTWSGPGFKRKQFNAYIPRPRPARWQCLSRFNCPAAEGIVIIIKTAAELRGGVGTPRFVVRPRRPHNRGHSTGTVLVLYWALAGQATTDKSATFVT